jgi:hypothetical protein
MEIGDMQRKNHVFLVTDTPRDSDSGTCDCPYTAAKLVYYPPPSTLIHHSPPPLSTPPLIWWLKNEM